VLTVEHLFAERFSTVIKMTTFQAEFAADPRTIKAYYLQAFSATVKENSIQFPNDQPRDTAIRIIEAHGSRNSLGHPKTTDSLRYSRSRERPCGHAGPKVRDTL
jgi:hypothetical protein